jgi:hypothetical protein
MAWFYWILFQEAHGGLRQSINPEGAQKKKKSDSKKIP